MTQELVSSLLGVRRESVTRVALHLQEAGVLRYNRGHISVLDRRRLEEAACECYTAARQEAERLSVLPYVPFTERHVAAA